MEVEGDLPPQFRQYRGGGGEGNNPDEEDVEAGDALVNNLIGGDDGDDLEPINELLFNHPRAEGRRRRNAANEDGGGTGDGGAEAPAAAPKGKRKNTKRRKAQLSAEELISSGLDFEPPEIAMPDPEPSNPRDELLNEQHRKEIRKTLAGLSEPRDQEINMRRIPFITLLRLAAGSNGMNVSACFARHPPNGCLTFEDHDPYLDTLAFNALRGTEDWLVIFSKQQLGIDKFLTSYERGYGDPLLSAIANLTGHYMRTGVRRNPTRGLSSKTEQGRNDDLELQFLKDLKLQTVRWMKFPLT